MFAPQGKLVSLCVIALSVFVLPGVVAAQQETLTVTPSSCVFKMGDDLSWAQPNLDERDWLKTEPSRERVLPVEPHQWTRCRLDLRQLARTGPAFLQIEKFSAWQVFVDGEQIGAFGDMETGRYWMDLVQRRAIPQRIVDRGVVLVALRETQRGLLPIRYSAHVDPISAGAERTLVDETGLGAVAGFSNRLLQFICYGFIGTAGIFLLILSGVDRSRRDLFWLAVVCLGM